MILTDVDGHGKGLVGPSERAVNQTGERLRGFLGNVEQTIDG